MISKKQRQLDVLHAMNERCAGILMRRIRNEISQDDALRLFREEAERATREYEAIQNTELPS